MQQQSILSENRSIDSFAAAPKVLYSKHHRSNQHYNSNTVISSTFQQSKEQALSKEVQEVQILEQLYNMKYVKLNEQEEKDYQMFEFYIDKPDAAMYRPSGIYDDKGTQIETNDLFDFDIEVEPIIQILIAKTVQQSQVEIAVEDHDQQIAKQKQHFEMKRQLNLHIIQQKQQLLRRKEEQTRLRKDQYRLYEESQKTVQKKLYLAEQMKREVNRSRDMLFNQYEQLEYYGMDAQQYLRKNYLPFLIDQTIRELEFIDDCSSAFKMMNEEIQVQYEKYHIYGKMKYRQAIQFQDQEKLRLKAEKYAQKIERERIKERQKISSNVGQFRKQIQKDLEGKKQTVDDIMKLQIVDLGFTMKEKDIRIGLPGGFVYQLWYLLNGLNKMYIDHQEQQQCQTVVNTNQSGISQQSNASKKNQQQQIDYSNFQFFNDRVLINLIVELLYKSVKQPIVIQMNEEMKQNYEKIVQSMNQDYKMFNIRREKIINQNLPIREALSMLFNKQTMFYKLMSSNPQQLDMELLQSIVKAILMIHFRKMRDNQTINDLPYEEQNIFFAKAKIKIEFESDQASTQKDFNHSAQSQVNPTENTKEDQQDDQQEQQDQQKPKDSNNESQNQQEIETQKEQSRMNSRIDEIQKTNTSQSSHHRVNLIQKTDESYMSKQENQGYSIDIFTQKITQLILRFNSELNLKIKLKTKEQPPEQLPYELYDGFDNDYLFQRHPSYVAKDISLVRLEVYQKVNSLADYETVVYYQNAVHLLRLQLFNIIIKQIRELGFIEYPKLSQYYIQKDLELRKLSDKYLREFMKFGVVFDYGHVQDNQNDEKKEKEVNEQEQEQEQEQQ